VLKLVYHTAVLGAIDLEYDRPVVRVGRSEDNDMVLRDPSVERHHCVLVFRGEKALCLPPSQAIPAQTELWRLDGPEYGAGETIRIGKLQFSLAHSSKTVAIPEVQRPGPRPDASASEAVNQRRYYCPNCRTFVPEREVKRMGLVAHAKRDLCPKCSHLLEAELEPQEPPPDPRKQTRRGAKKLTTS
jgi:hypothetical protein